MRGIHLLAGDGEKRTVPGGRQVNAWSVLRGARGVWGDKGLSFLSPPILRFSGKFSQPCRGGLQPVVAGIRGRKSGRCSACPLPGMAEV